MNYYIVVEGNKTENKIYPKWINILNPNLIQIYNICNFDKDNYYLITGGGYPNYFNIIKNSITDFKKSSDIDKLVIAVDSEDFSYSDKYKQIENLLKADLSEDEYEIIIQHFCIETWALGNKVIYSKNAQSIELRELQRHHNISTNDPELLVGLEDNNRAQTAYKYLRLLIKEKNYKLSYTKRNPKVITDKKYFQRIIDRYNEGEHIQSFKTFYTIFNDN